MNDSTGLLSKMAEWLLKNITGSNLAIRLFLSKEKKDILKEETYNGPNNSDIMLRYR